MELLDQHLLANSVNPGFSQIYSQQVIATLSSSDGDHLSSFNDEVLNSILVLFLHNISPIFGQIFFSIKRLDFSLLNRKILM